MKRICFVQARVGSARLPGKVLADIDGEPMLTHQLRRLARSRMTDEVVVLTTTQPEDDAIEAVSATSGVRVIRGSEQDVLARFVRGATMTGAEVVVRVTGDCPLIDPDVVDLVVTELVSHRERCDYASNVLRRTYPRGLDVEALFTDVLLRIERFASTPAHREHVTLLLRESAGGRFLLRSVESPTDDSDIRLTVDEPSDLELIRLLFSEMRLGKTLSPYGPIVDYIRAHPNVGGLNRGVQTWSPV